MKSNSVVLSQLPRLVSVWGCRGRFESRGLAFCPLFALQCNRCRRWRCRVLLQQNFLHMLLYFCVIAVFGRKVLPCICERGWSGGAAEHGRYVMESRTMTARSTATVFVPSLSFSKWDSFAVKATTPWRAGSLATGSGHFGLFSMIPRTVTVSFWPPATYWATAIVNEDSWRVTEPTIPTPMTIAGIFHAAMTSSESTGTGFN